MARGRLVKRLWAFGVTTELKDRETELLVMASLQVGINNDTENDIDSHTIVSRTLILKVEIVKVVNGCKVFLFVPI